MSKYKLQKEDTVSADRKTKIVFDPDAWQKKDRSGKKIVSIANRQNFNNSKFTRRANKGLLPIDDIEETTQNTGTSTIDGVNASSNNPTASTKSGTVTDQSSDESGSKKSNKNCQIEFVTGTPTGNGASKTNNDQHSTNTRGKIGETVVIKALKAIKTNRHTGTEYIPFDPPYTKNNGGDGTIIDKGGNRHTPMSQARHLAQSAIKDGQDELKKSKLNKEETDSEKNARHSKDLNDLEQTIRKSGDMGKATQNAINQRRKDLVKDKLNTEDVKGESDRQITFYKFLTRLKRAGIKIPASIVGEETMEEMTLKSFMQFTETTDDMLDANDHKRSATKAVPETPKSERDPKIERYKPAKFDPAAAARRKRIDAHQAKIARKNDDDLGW